MDFHEDGILSLIINNEEIAVETVVFHFLTINHFEEDSCALPGIWVTYTILAEDVERTIPLRELQGIISGTL